MKFSKALVTLASLAPLFLFDQAAAAVVTTRSDESSAHVVIPYGNGEDNSSDRKKERELETADHDIMIDARLLNDVTVFFTPEGTCPMGCGIGTDYDCSPPGDASNSWNDGKRPFIDPLNTCVKRIIATVWGATCEVPYFTMSLNGNYLTTFPELTDDCLCGKCGSQTRTVEINPSWYYPGEENIIQVQETSSSKMCLNRIELELFPTDCPSQVPSGTPIALPSLTDDEQCKKNDPENDYCAKLGGHCKVDCEDDEDHDCIPHLCSYDRYWEKPTKSPKMRQLHEEEADIVERWKSRDEGMRECRLYESFCRLHRNVAASRGGTSQEQKTL